MINLTPTQKIIDADRADRRIFKKSLKTRSIENEWKLDKIDQYGSMDNYNTIQRNETARFIKEVLT